MKTLEQLMEEIPLERQAKVKALSEQLIQEVGLAHLREELNISQKQLAEALGISQPAVAKIEQKDNDPRLSTLKRYIEAMGGKLSLTVQMPMGDSRIFRI